MSSRGGGGRGGSFSRGGNGVRGGGGGGAVSGAGGGKGEGSEQGFPSSHYAGRDNVVPLLDDTVRTLENDRQAARRTISLSSLSLDEHALPTRPGYGTGNKNDVVVWANYVRMTPCPDLVLYRYNISESEITPKVIGRKRGQVIRLLLRDHLAGYTNDMVSDFRTTVLCRKEIEFEKERFIKVPYVDEMGDRGATAVEYIVDFPHPKKLVLKDLMDYLSSKQPMAGCPDKLETIQALNIFLKHHARSVVGNLAMIGSSKRFSMGANAATCNLRGGLTAVRGYFTSVRPATKDILVNINVSHGVFYPPQDLRTLIGAFRKKNENGDDVALQRFLKRVRVRVTHLKPKKNEKGEEVFRVRTIFGLADPRSDGLQPAQPKSPKAEKPDSYQPRPQIDSFGAGPRKVKFWMSEKDGKPARYVSVYDHFKSTYSMKLDTNCPVLNVGTSQNPCYLPAEVCVVLRGQNSTSKLDRAQTDAMIGFAVRRPEENAKSIVQDGLATAGLTSQNPLLARFGIEMGTDLITVPARVLPGPQSLLYGNKKKITPENGGWNLRNVEFASPTLLKKWEWLILGPPLTHELSLKQAFTRMLNKCGVSVTQKRLPDGHHITPYDNNTATLVHKVFEGAVKSNLDVLLVILPKADTQLYNRIKILGDIRYGIHTVCVVGSKFTKSTASYFANVALKFNLKLGGSNQTLARSDLSLIADEETMIVGIDVTHPSPGSSDAAPSIAGMVASVDKSLGQWPGVVSVQQGKKETVNDLSGMLKSRLELWKTASSKKAYPENIVVYRDGVSEGQYAIILRDEVPLLEAACRELYPGGKLPSISVIIVGKRHHTRFYPTKRENGDAGGNCKPGTVVDRVVTEEGTWDFFLQAHAVLKGTGRPAHYVVIRDDIFVRRANKYQTKAADDLERLTQALCYVFGRATKAVSICTPAYYADILCERARRYVADVYDGSGGANAQNSTIAAVTAGVRVHDKLKDKMYYI